MGQPSSTPLTPSAWLSRPGPLQSNRAWDMPRRCCMTARPVIGSSARISTALPDRSAPHTTFRHQCSPYDR